MGENEKSKAEILQEHLINRVNKAYSIYNKKLLWCKTEFSEESVHDFRVATRRLMSLIDLIDGVYPSVYGPELSGTLKKRMKKFGPLRDTQVQMISVGDLRWRFPEMTSYYHELIRREEKYIKKLRKIINKYEAGEFDGTIFFLKFDIKYKFNNADQAFESLFDSVRKAFQKVRRRNEFVDPSEPETIHRVRIAFKKYRYMVEHLKRFIDIDDEGMATLKEFQTIMGEIQDNRVLTESLDEFIDSQHEIPEKAFKEIREKLLRQRTELIDEFMKSSEKIKHFHDLKFKY
jgi:CHAD domain-containing protein